MHPLVRCSDADRAALQSHRSRTSMATSVGAFTYSMTASVEANAPRKTRATTALMQFHQALAAATHQQTPAAATPIGFAGWDLQLHCRASPPYVTDPGRLGLTGPAPESYGVSSSSFVNPTDTRLTKPRRLQSSNHKTKGGLCRDYNEC